MKFSVLVQTDNTNNRQRYESRLTFVLCLAIKPKVIETGLFQYSHKTVVAHTLLNTAHSVGSDCGCNPG